MNTQITTTPKLFIGMDMHKKSWSLHFRTDLFDHRGFSMPPNQEVLYEHVNRTFPGHEIYLTYEPNVIRCLVSQFVEILECQTKT